MEKGLKIPTIMTTLIFLIPARLFTNKFAFQNHHRGFYGDLRRRWKSSDEMEDGETQIFAIKQTCDSKIWLENENIYKIL